MSKPPPSRCSAKCLLSFKWYPGPYDVPGDDEVSALRRVFLEHVYDEVQEPLERQRMMNIAEFNRVLKMAREGKLVPVKEVDPTRVPGIFEIRWRNFPVTGKNASGIVEIAKKEVRLYHSEPDKFPTHFVGHVLHVKKIFDGDKGMTTSAQDSLIDSASQIRRIGENENWRIAS